MSNSAPMSTPASPAAPTDDPARQVTGGVDTHRDTHVAAAVDAVGRVLGTAAFATTTAGYAALLAWLQSFGVLAVVGVEGTGSYGAGLTRHLAGQDVRVLEVERPNRQNRRRRGKSDAIDAEAAARTVQSGQASATPKLRTGPVESLRVLRETRDQLVKARTALLNTLRALLVTAPDDLRESLAGLTPTALVAACTTLEATPLPKPGLRGTARTHARQHLAEDLLDAEAATRTALTDLAATITSHDQRITTLNTRLDVLTATIAPRTRAQHGVGPDTAAQLLITAGTHPDRIRNEAALARLTGTAPLDASSGLNHHHRLSRAGDRDANCALYRITLTRMASCPRTRTYIANHLTPNGNNKKHLIRMLKRYITRELYPHITADLTNLTT